MKMSIVCVGKIKEQFYRDALAEYAKRLSRYVSWEIVEVADEKTLDNASAAEERQVLATEGERILKHLSDDAYKIALCIDGMKADSVGFARMIEKIKLDGFSHIQFIIGGSLGLAPEVIKKADRKLSFSDMTFPHQLMRVILSEQVYRACRISSNEPYHK